MKTSSMLVHIYSKSTWSTDFDCVLFIIYKIKMDEKKTAFMFKTWLNVANALPNADQFKSFINMIFEYQFEWIVPNETTDPTLKAFFEQIKRSIDKRNSRNQKISNTMKWNQNAVKNFENISKQMKTDENSWQQIKQKRKKENKNKKEKGNNNQTEFDEISNEISIAPKQEFWNSEINELIDQIKTICDENGIVYDRTDDRKFAHHILTANAFGDFCEKIWQSRIEFAKNVLIASVKIWFRKWPCSWPKKIYQNFADVFNETMSKKQKKFYIPSI